MRKKTIVNIFHYGVKYLLIALPLILMLICYIVPDNKDVTINYKFDTNDVYSATDLKVGNIYELTLTADNFPANAYYFSVEYIDISRPNYELTSQAEYFSTNYIRFGLLQYNGVNRLYFLDGTGNIFYQYNDNYVLNVVYNATLLEGTPNLTYENFSKSNNVPVASVVNNSLDTKIYTWLDNFANLPINQFYNDFGEVFGLDNIDTHSPLGFVYYMPLWILYIYIFDLMLDTIVFIPKLAHKWMEKLGGYDD